ncbi:unnamed protein product [Prorocentrum cordatum]|uniref:Uncharacterized protein n=1 Tax=Prorocentrum cordatum TaxID=2364126 RepID=A0ABN9PUU8_9DINO|nr:unnamed protein product [Polarella glacialis]
MAGRYAAEARACRHAAAQSAAEDEAQDAPATTWQSCGRAPHAGRRRGCRLAQEPGAARCAAGSVDSACRRAVALHHRQRRAAPKQAGGRAPPPAAAAKRAARLSEAELRRFRDVAFGGCD